MKNAAVLLALLAMAPAGLAAQAQGDSIRLRVPPSRAWTQGHFVSLDATQLTITHADSNQTYPVQMIGRLEVRRHKKVGVTLLTASLACMAGAALVALPRPNDQQKVSDGVAIAIAGGIGLGFGALELLVEPWHWKRVRVGVQVTN